MKKSIEEMNNVSCGIAAEMRRAGIKTAELLGDNGKTGDARVTVWQVGPVRVAATNGDPVWEEQDPELFAELLESEGIRI